MQYQIDRYELPQHEPLLPMNVLGEARTAALVEDLCKVLARCMAEELVRFNAYRPVQAVSESQTPVRVQGRVLHPSHVEAVSELLGAPASVPEADHRCVSAGKRWAREMEAAEQEAKEINDHALSVGAAHARWVKPGTVVRPGARHVFKTPGMAKRFGARTVNSGASW